MKRGRCNLSVMLMAFAFQERLEDLERSLKSGDIYNEKILELPKRKVPPLLPIATLHRR